MNSITVSEEVASALSQRRPVVALESTIISHGMPYPRNVETALAVEETIRQGGATPATIAVLQGCFKAGLTQDEIAYLGKQGTAVAKCSRRDLPFVIAGKRDGATTVAGTMIGAALAGIKVFVTGGIGGVHRGGAETFDISADLQELGKTNTAVVCAGVKSILDIGLTLEYLETLGVPVIGFRTDYLPGFYTRNSGFPVDFRMDSAAEIADLLRAKQTLGLSGGVLIANPIPEKDSFPKEEIDRIIGEALDEASMRKIKGKKVTPFLLEKIAAFSGGRSLEANIKLVLNNAQAGAEIASAYTRLADSDSN
ncbi:MAG: pseudouridine-5'-phosphate glycosidase [Spirochaetaceae bacterium]|jgi:pseudouridine-5'-phosphate glycosidase|nr:pseudouridine-5'-phosphate glycosidase [Spirochaetaceae bacterium]